MSLSKSFSQIPAVAPYPPKLKGKLSTYHSEIINYAMKHYSGTKDFKMQIAALMNTVSAMVISGDTMPSTWPASNPFDGIELQDPTDLKSNLGNLFIDWRTVNWDIEEVADITTEFMKNYMKASPKLSQYANNSVTASSNITIPTPKESLYIRPPIYPQFDITKPWLNVNHNGAQYTIYSTLPIVPKTQSQISVTTNVGYMTSQDLLNLFPNQVIHTRAPAMYDPVEGLEYDENLGAIFPINGFTMKQIKENIIKYPHFYKLQRVIGENITSFYSHIEIDGTLYNTLDIWDKLLEIKDIPKTSEYIKEYVVRRYLLERDSGMLHKYPIFGSLDPFLTLFMPASLYIKYGFSDPEELAKSCVTSRVQYKRTRNPIIRAVYNLP